MNIQFCFEISFDHLLSPGGDHDGQDPQGEREAGEGQVQDAAGGEEGEHQAAGGPVREHVTSSKDPLQQPFNNSDSRIQTDPSSCDLSDCDRVNEEPRTGS